MSFNYNQTQLSIIDSVQNIMTNFDDDYWLKCDKESNFPHEFYQEIANGGWLGICNTRPRRTPRRLTTAKTAALRIAGPGLHPR